MATSERGVEEQLMEAGNRLLQSPSSVDELLPLLDQVESFLSRVEQSPPKSMQTALSPSMKALVGSKLLRHSDVDVKVAVASCISEITRITAPDAPYDDDQMKDVFQLIVSSFESLSDESSRSYSKRTSILETVAKVRSCVVMLDLECDGLIIEMFQHFLKAIRDYHPENVFSSMETIMTLVLEESEDIAPELLSPILDSVKRSNEGVLPIARKLGERVLKNCAIKLKPYLTVAMKSLRLSLDDYSDVVASICEGTTGAAEHSENIASGEKMVAESKLATASSDDAAQADESRLATETSDAPQVAKESVIVEASAEEVNPPIDRSPKSVMSNGVASTEKEEGLTEPEASMKATQSVDTNGMSKVEPDDSDNVKSVKPEAKQEQNVKRRGKKANSLISSTEPSNSSQVDGEKEVEEHSDHPKSRSKEVPASPSEDPPVDTAISAEKQKDIGVAPSTPKAAEDESVNVASPKPSGALPDESRSKKMARSKKKGRLTKETSPSTDIVSKKASERTSDSELKPQKRSGKKSSKIIIEDKSPVQADKIKNDVSASDSEAKSLRHSGKKVEAGSDAEPGSPLRKKGDGKRRGRGKAAPEKDVPKPAAKADDKEIVSSPKSPTELTEEEGDVEETPKTNSKRKRTPGKDKASGSEELGENLNGSKVKVWWPKDRAFYEGVIESYDPVKKKHKVVYTDGDEEILNLRKERWEVIEHNAESMSDGEQVTENTNPDASTDMHKKKKARTSSETSAKQGRMETSPKRVGGASSSKSKGAATKSVLKLDEDSKADDSKSKPVVSKSGGKPKDSGSKSKSKSQRSGKSVEDASEPAAKSKDVDVDTPKPSTKSKQEPSKTVTKDTPKTAKKDTPKASTKDTPKTGTKSNKGLIKSGSKTNANDKEKVKPSSSKVDTEESKGKSSDSGKTPESGKGKSSDASKSLTKSGKKRRRGARS